LGLGVVGVQFVLVSLFARSSVSLLEEEEEEEELEKDKELLFFFMLSSLAFTDLLHTFAICLEKSPEAKSEEEQLMTIG
jgi:hypothetical protein